MSRHRCPIGTNANPKLVQAAVLSHPETVKNLADVTNAGKDALGSMSWWQGIFIEVDGNENFHIQPSEFSAMASRFEAEIGPSPNDFKFAFHDVDKNRDGRIGIAEWEAYAKLVEEEFGRPRCLMAAWRFLGRRRVAPPKQVKNIFVHEGYNSDSSLQLLTACAKQDSDNLYDAVRKAIDQQADPNASLASAHCNGYTPLIFLSMATSINPGDQVANCIHLLIDAKADVHRESGVSGALGRLLPTRVAAQFQNPKVLDALLDYVDVGDRFQWAAGEHNEPVMLRELEKVCGLHILNQISRKSNYNAQATILLIMFASPLYGAKLSAAGARKLLNGEFEGIKPTGSGCCRADPNGRGLDGTTALMEMAKKGETETVKVLLNGRASPLQQDAEGATPLHFAAAGLHSGVVKALMDANADPSMTDHAGFSAWMMVGEEKYNQSNPGEEFLLKDNTAREVIFEMLAPMDVKEVLDLLNPTQWEELIEDGDDSDSLTKKLRLHESLFFDYRANTGKGRAPRTALLDRCAEMIMGFLRTDPLKGNMKMLTKYLLQATMGPVQCCLKHVRVQWATNNNRSGYDLKLKELVTDLLDGFEMDCNKFKREIEKDADENPKGACAALLALPSNSVDIPEEWQDDSYWEDAEHWRQVQKRQLLRFDPEWARNVKDGATCCLALLRLDRVKELSEYSGLLQVHHRPMELLLAEGYLKYSELCNKPFQDLMCKVVRNGAAKKSNVTYPSEYVGVKKLKRLSEKIRDARSEQGSLDWPGRSQEYLAFSHCFYILDTVRLSFVCNGDTQRDEVACCLDLVNVFKSCTLAKDKLQLLRLKNGFAEGVVAAGGYADVKLLVYADLGEYRAFDGTVIPLRIIGEVQLILHGYQTVKSRMHLAYEINRGSFGDLPEILVPTDTILPPDLALSPCSPSRVREDSTRSDGNSPVYQNTILPSSLQSAKQSAVNNYASDETHKAWLPEAAVMSRAV